MKKEYQVSSQELSKRLKELGIKQDSLFSWFDTERYGLILKESSTLFDLDHYLSVQRIGSAFTVAELGEMLFAFNIVTFKYKKGGKYIYEIAVQDIEMRISKKYQSNFKAETEANARAKMLIHLIGVVTENRRNFRQYLNMY